MRMCVVVKCVSVCVRVRVCGGWCGLAVGGQTDSERGQRTRHVASASSCSHIVACVPRSPSAPCGSCSALTLIGVWCASGSGRWGGRWLAVGREPLERDHTHTRPFCHAHQITSQVEIQSCNWHGWRINGYRNQKETQKRKKPKQKKPKLTQGVRWRASQSPAAASTSHPVSCPARVGMHAQKR